ncbi:SH3 domain-containing protein [Lewinella sp. 4G2]|uniref:SH3 domain-containing protein n=1 Tax=Lewinella sp. 4G2 TaxID=1803372 RepID=UPI0007B4D86E|nr:SH3 domain-containing protein [Lewinella sp. 4G2]OAV44668.1 hypothetical protein A3850_009265 [Lewinella sp. 4G2]
MKSLSPFLFLFGFVLLLSACGGNEEVATVDPAPVQPTDSAPAAAPASKGRIVWVDGLSLRESPSLTAKRVAKMKNGEVVKLTGQKSDENENAVLRGVLYSEPWYELTTEDGKQGWAHGGGLKGNREVKGNRPLTDTKFNFPYFGEFDLSGWKKTGPTSTSAGDFDYTTTTYVGDGQRLSITTTGTESGSEYGYNFDYLLQNSRGDTLKTRYFSYNNDIREIEEVVVDYMGAEPTQHRRTQSVSTAYQQLKGYPLMARGEWKSQPLSEVGKEDFEI